MLKSNFNAIEGPVTVSSHKSQRRMKRTVRGLMIRTNADTGKSERRELTRPRKRNGQMKSDTDWNRTYVRLRQHG